VKETDKFLLMIISVMAVVVAVIAFMAKYATGTLKLEDVIHFG
jgi:hypothetical protein